MGLDMHLLKKEGETHQEVGYWRKANHIHAWFVKNVQEGEDDCGMYPVSREQLALLLETCKAVKAGSTLEDSMVQNGSEMVAGMWVPIMVDGKVITNPEVAESLLPTQGGFFFGGTDYDEYYMNDVDETIRICEEALLDEEAEHFYASSW